MIAENLAEDALAKILNSGDNAFIFIHSTGCGHCIEAKPHWTNAVKAFSSTNNPGLHLITLDVDKTLNKYSNDMKKMLGEVNGVPAIRHYKNKQHTDFNDERTKDAFMKWFAGKNGKSSSKSSKSVKGGKNKNGKSKNKRCKHKRCKKGKHKTRKCKK
jgi:Thioredoxin